MKHIFNKHIDERGKKDWRKEWVGPDKSANADRSCRHGGNCDYCRNRRLYREKRQKENTKDQLDG